MTRQSSPIVEFITARLDEAKRDIKQIEEYGGCCSGCHCGCADPARLLRDLGAKRRILAEFERCGPHTQGYPGLRFSVLILAEVWAEHEDYVAAVGAQDVD
ncbi:DUF6221 family protein [Streptosporangium sp. NPDC023963]|uniref:DUF6221 family protein n=1 Tax=Streptosporangium sp. NPDC023963 TaxID=3155608 RepID=UPI003432EBDC